MTFRTFKEAPVKKHKYFKKGVGAVTRMGLR